MESEPSVAVDAAQAPQASAVETSAELPPDDVATAPVGCEPECNVWQTCTNAACTPKACSTDGECNAVPLPAGVDKHFCYKGKCQAYQCAKDPDCPGGQLCNTMLYLCYDIPKGCSTAQQCDDGDKCTADVCELDATCSHKAINLCCATNFSCDDSKLCTIDTCKNGQCAWQQTGQCCVDSKDCKDTNPCTQDLCQGGVCAHPPAIGCCKSAVDCDDNDPASTDGCSAGTCTHVWTGLAATCSATVACTQNACTKGSCASGLCTYSKPTGPSCCTADAQCLLDGVCQQATCAATVCGLKAVKGQGTHLRNRFDTAALNGWVVEKTSSSVAFHFATLTQVSGTGALRYGIPNKVSFEDQTANKGAVVSPAITLPAGPALRFWTLLDVSPGAAIHQCGVDVMDAGTGAKLAAAWSKNGNLASGTTSAKWMQQTVTLPANLAGKAIKLRAWFDQTKYDTSNKDKFGWLIDELEVLGNCP
ncbi:MAG: hypothetical protein EXR77_02635 [Myxococcales bacterium]|nr:hypothetical protein [Myxococcales bacterium]